MTANRDDPEFADIDTYISRQLSEAVAALTEHTDIQARLDAALGAARRDSKPSGAADTNNGR